MRDRPLFASGTCLQKPSRPASPRPVLYPFITCSHHGRSSSSSSSPAAAAPNIIPSRPPPPLPFRLLFHGTWDRMGIRISVGGTSGGRSPRQQREEERRHAELGSSERVHLNPNFQSTRPLLARDSARG